MGYHVNPDFTVLGFKDFITDITNSGKNGENDNFSDAYISRVEKVFHDAENVGSAITYRCVESRNCKVCKSHCQIETMIIKQAFSQDIINQSFEVNIIIEQLNNCTNS